MIVDKTNAFDSSLEHYNMEDWEDKMIQKSERKNDLTMGKAWKPKRLVCLTHKDDVYKEQDTNNIWASHVLFPVGTEKWPLIHQPEDQGLRWQELLWGMVREKESFKDVQWYGEKKDSGYEHYKPLLYYLF